MNRAAAAAGAPVHPGAGARRRYHAARWLVPPRLSARPRHDRAGGAERRLAGNAYALAWAKGQESKDQQKPEALRTLKTVRASLVEDAPVVFYWRLSVADVEPAGAIAGLARHVAALGWGVDAVAAARAVAADPPPDGGALWVPALGSVPLRVPTTGFLQALDRRHAAFQSRLDRRGRAMSSPPPVTGFGIARHAAPGEARAAPWLAYRFTDGGDGFVMVPEAKLPCLVDVVRERLKHVLGVERAARMTLCPLASLGHRHADGAARRLLAVLPPDADSRAVTELDFALDRAALMVGEIALVLEPDRLDDSPFLGASVAPDGGLPATGLLWRSVFALRPAAGKATPRTIEATVLRAASAAGISSSRITHLRASRPAPWPHRPAAGAGALRVELELASPHAGPLVLPAPHVAGEGGLPVLMATAPLPTMARFVLAGRDRPPVEDTASVTDRFRRAAIAMWGHDAEPVPPVLGGRGCRWRWPYRPPDRLCPAWSSGVRAGGARPADAALAGRRTGLAGRAGGVRRAGRLSGLPPCVAGKALRITLPVTLAGPLALGADCHRGITLLRVGDALGFLRVHYDTRAPGLARVLEVTDVKRHQGGFPVLSSATAASIPW